MDVCTKPTDFIWRDCAEYLAIWNPIAIAIFVAYVPTMFLIQAYMRNREAYDLTVPLKAWNCAMSILSGIGFCINIPYLFGADMTFEQSYTSLDFRDGITGFAVMWFLLSKIPELMDTLFIVLRKKPLGTLHWFHHVTVAIYCWISIQTSPSIGYWFSTMNMFVHGIMYGYFAFAHEMKQLTWFNPMILTVLQIVQMVWGLVVTGAYAVHPTTEFDTTTMISIGYAVPMYASYLYLFCKFFESKYKFKTPVNWGMCGYLLAAHILAIFGASRCWSRGVGVFVETIGWYVICGMGVTVGMHRLWSHRSFKARAPMRFVLFILASASNQGSIYHWCRDHRVHHKHSDEDGDPHDIRRGFFYSHVGWLMLKKDPVVKEKGADLDCTDLLLDPFIRFNRTFDPICNIFFCYVVPGIYGIWRLDSFWDGFLIFGGFRYVLELHATWCVNSVAHTFGYHPYKDIPPSENLFVSIIANGEGWHNFHHTYPYDYATAEHNWWIQLNTGKMVIDFMYLIGQAYDRKRKIMKPTESSGAALRKQSICSRTG
jgi:fatty-acid desaturase